jgi:hypothetical protein
MHVSQVRDMKTETSKDMWLMAWRLQRLNKAGSPDYPLLLLMMNNLMEAKGRRGKLFTMILIAKRCHYKKILGEKRGLGLMARLYMMKLKRIELGGEYDLSCNDCSWNGLYGDVFCGALGLCPACDSPRLFDLAIPF